ncbi:hypothetical protein QUG92_15570 [Curtobacterium sp. RHCKG23]|uniref:Uncharacterized protein n=1 Tax=Curtobacterium citri TaxID=3055139 RepID=A0ABT7TC91_9MICO|nr:hypothetical protein [Curtobacterium citri]MDM7886529.1 hypothetical protein [Curtobacterium citri]
MIRHISRSAKPSSEDKRQYLEQIQAIISRMAAASSAAKTWMLPIVTAAYGYALVETEVKLALLGMAATSVFAVLDAGYLRQERAFRALYQAASQGKVAAYDMNVARYYNRSNADNQDVRAANCEWRKIIWSWSLAGFYVPVVSLGSLFILGIELT